MSDWKPDDNKGLLGNMKSLFAHKIESDKRKKEEKHAKVKDKMRIDGVEEHDIEEQFYLWLSGIYSIENYRQKKKEEAEHYASINYIRQDDRHKEERHKAEVRKLNAETGSIEVETARKMELVKMIKQIRKNDLASFPTELKYFVIACQAGDVDALNDIMQGAVLKDYLARKQEAETLGKEHDAEEKALANENKRLNLQQKKKDLGL